MKKSKLVWFWDSFPKYCSVAWVVCLVAAMVATALWSETIFTWGTEHLVLFGFSMALLILLVAIGNFVPGIPNMPAPLIVGWACSMGMCDGWTVAFGLMIANIALLGSILGFLMGFLERDAVGETTVEAFELNVSKQHQKAETFYGTSPNPILWSRFWKKAAYCGHVNVIAGSDRRIDSLQFAVIAGFGHFLWTIQYLATGYIIGWLLPYVGHWIR